MLFNFQGPCRLSQAAKTIISHLVSFVKHKFSKFCDFLSQLASQSGESDYITLFSICQQQISFLCDFSSFAPLSRDSFAIIPPSNTFVNGFLKVFFANLPFCKNCIVSPGVEHVPRHRRLCIMYSFNIHVLMAKALQRCGLIAREISSPARQISVSPVYVRTY